MTRDQAQAYLNPKPWTKTNGQQIWNYSFLGHQAAQNSNPWKRINKPYKCPSLPLGENFQAAVCRKGKDRRSLAVSLIWVDKSGSPGRPRKLDLAGPSTRKYRTSHTQRERKGGEREEEERQKDRQRQKEIETEKESSEDLCKLFMKSSTDYWYFWGNLKLGG